MGTQRSTPDRNDGADGDEVKKKIIEQLKGVAEVCRNATKGEDVKGYWNCGYWYVWNDKTGMMIEVVNFNGQGSIEDYRGKNVKVEEVLGCYARGNNFKTKTKKIISSDDWEDWGSVEVNV